MAPRFFGLLQRYSCLLRQLTDLDLQQLIETEQKRYLDIPLYYNVESFDLKYFLEKMKIVTSFMNDPIFPHFLQYFFCFISCPNWPCPACIVINTHVGSYENKTKKDSKF